MIVAELVTGAARNFIERNRIASNPWLRGIVASLVLLLLPFAFRLDGRAHSNWLQFLGRFHPALLHIPIGLLVLLPILEIVGTRKSALRESADFVLRLALALALPTLALGYMLAYGAGDTGATVMRHLWGAIALCIGLMFCVLARPQWAAGARPRVYPALLSLSLLALLWTGHQGGTLTHGSGYLTRYVPGGLGRIFANSSAEQNVSPASFYALQIHPVLDAKCAACHSSGEVKGGLRLDTYDEIMRGGKDGAVIQPGKPESSLLLARVALPTTDQHYMPADGRTPLTAEEIAWISAWVRAGASPTDVTVPGVSITQRRTEPPPQPVGDYSALMPEILRMNQGQGAKLVPLSSKPSDGLILRTVDIAPTFGDSQLATFQRFAPYIVEAELGRTAITDASFDTLRTFTHLRALHIEGTAITGQNIAKLVPLSQLTYLNLSNTKVTASNAAALKSLKQLRHIYLFNTPAQPDDTTTRSTP